MDPPIVEKERPNRIGGRSTEQEEILMSPLRVDFCTARNGYGRNASWLDQGAAEISV
jgi:hypothetical protein